MGLVSLREDILERGADHLNRIHDRLAKNQIEASRSGKSKPSAMVGRVHLRIVTRESQRVRKLIRECHKVLMELLDKMTDPAILAIDAIRLKEDYAIALEKISTLQERVDALKRYEKSYTEDRVSIQALKKRLDQRDADYKQLADKMATLVAAKDAELRRANDKISELTARNEELQKSVDSMSWKKATQQIGSFTKR